MTKTRSGPPRTLPDRRCPCGVIFRPHHHDHAHCSRACGQRYGRHVRAGTAEAQAYMRSAIRASVVARRQRAVARLAGLTPAQVYQRGYAAGHQAARLGVAAAWQARATYWEQQAKRGRVA